MATTSHTEPNENTTAEEAAESKAVHRSDRPPTAEESRDAEQAAQGVDVDEVGKHFEEMGDIGANVKGEGRIGS